MTENSIDGSTEIHSKIAFMAALKVVPRCDGAESPSTDYLESLR